jgi:ABC-2 type transport system permease protein
LKTGFLKLQSMLRLLKIEFLKYRHYKTFLVITGLYIVFLLGTFISFNELSFGPFKIFSKEVFKFPYVWYNVSFLAKFFNIYLSLIIIFIVTNEYSFRTIRQNVIDGLSKSQIVYSKFLMALLFSLVATALVGLISLVLGLLNSEIINASVVLKHLPFLIGFFVHAITLMSLAALTGFLLKKNGLSILIFLPYVIFLERIVRNIIGFDFVKYFPIRVINDIMQYPYIDMLEDQFDLATESMPWINVIVGLAFSFLFFYLSLLLIKKRDL